MQMNIKTAYTIGYEGTDIDRFVATLVAVGIEWVADVRALPISRKKGFSKKALAERLSEVGIGYAHFAHLGDPKPGRDAAKSGDYDAFQKIYRAHFAQESSQNDLEKLSTSLAEKYGCLLCFERDARYCHRSIISEELRQNGFQIFDIYGDVPSRYDRFPQIRAGAHISQSIAAAE